VGWEAFPPFGIKPNIKAKQFSIPFKRKRVARKIKELKRKLFCFARRVSAGGNAERNHSSIFRSKKVRTSFSNCDGQNFGGVKEHLIPVRIWVPRQLKALAGGEHLVGVRISAARQKY